MTEQGRTVLKFAVMCNSLVLQQWQHKVLSSLIETAKAEPVLFVVRRHNPENIYSDLNLSGRYLWAQWLLACL